MTAWLVYAAVGTFLFFVVARGALLWKLWLEVRRLFIVLDLGAMALVRRVIPPRYALVGRCQKRGVCCESIVGNPPSFVKRRPWAWRLFAAYHRISHNFEVVGRGPDGELIFRCGHLKSDKRCGIYRHRPLLCRNYPRQPFYVPPILLPGCGYRVVHRSLSNHRPRPSLAIVNPTVSVHHPTRPGGRGVDEDRDHFESVQNPPPLEPLPPPPDI